MHVNKIFIIYSFFVYMCNEYGTLQHFMAYCEYTTVCLKIIYVQVRIPLKMKISNIKGHQYKKQRIQHLCCRCCREAVHTANGLTQKFKKCSQIFHRTMCIISWHTSYSHSLMNDEKILIRLWYKIHSLLTYIHVIKFWTSVYFSKKRH